MVKIEMQASGPTGSDVAITVFQDEVPIQRIVASIGYRTVKNEKIVPYVTTSVETPQTRPRLALVGGQETSL